MSSSLSIAEAASAALKKKAGRDVLVKAVLNWAEHSVREQLCLLEIVKLAVWFLIDVFDLGEQLCSRSMGRRSDVRNVGSAGYGSMLLIG